MVKSVSISSVASVLGVLGKVAVDFTDGGESLDLAALARHFAFYNPYTGQINLKFSQPSWTTYGLLVAPLIAKKVIRALNGGRLPSLGISGVGI